MIPLRDENPTTLFPWVTLSLIAANGLIFFAEMSLGPRLEPVLSSFGAVPAALLSGAPTQGGPPAIVTVFTSMFLHANLLHVGGNMLYLWIFGNNIEDVLGHGRFFLFYLVAGVVAVFSHAMVDPLSSAPMIGASGAVSGVLGAYLVLFPRVRVLTLVPVFFFIQLMRVPAMFVLGFWIVIQVLFGMFSVNGPGGGVAWFAHIGGFLTGAVLIRLLVRRGYSPRAGG